MVIRVAIYCQGGVEVSLCRDVSPELTLADLALQLDSLRCLAVEMQTRCEWAPLASVRRTTKRRARAAADKELIS